jgi:hypothetical protein
MSTTTTIDTNEGWTFADDKPVSEVPTTTEPDNNWGIPNATTPDEWDAPPPAPSPPLSAVGQPRTNDHASLHWTACYNDYCGVHRQMKDNNYYPRRANGRHRHNHQCPCENAHPFELAEVIRNRHLNPRRACAAWRKGKRVCPRCRFLVNMEGHENRCQTTTEQRTPLEEIQPPQENQENEVPAAPPTATDESQQTIPRLLAFVYDDLSTNIRQTQVQQRALAQATNEQHQVHQAQLVRITEILGGILAQQRSQPRAPPLTTTRSVRIHRMTPRRQNHPHRHDLAGASVWTGGVLSRTWHDRLLGAAAGAALTLATLWLILVSAATATVILRA